MESLYNPDGGFPILSLIAYVPLAGALILIFFIPKTQERLIKDSALCYQQVIANRGFEFLEGEFPGWEVTGE